MKLFKLFILVVSILLLGCQSGTDTPSDFMSHSSDSSTSSIVSSTSSIVQMSSALNTSSSSESSASTVSSATSNVSTSSASSAAPLTKLRIVSTPNPSLFPMIVAMHQNPELPVEIVPVTGSKTIDGNLSAGRGDALLSMTYVAAKKSEAGVIPPMRLHSVNYFSGFMLLTRRQDGITSIDSLKGKNILISGPIGSGKNGGPDIFFQAYLAQNALSTADFSMHYLSLNDGVAAIMNQTPLDNGDGDTTNDTPADAYLLVEPAATGMVMNTQSSDWPMEKSINTQLAFEPTGSWAYNELPLGGLSVLRSVSDNDANIALIDQVVDAYNRGAETLMASNTIKLMQYTNAIADKISTYYGEYGIAVPAAVITAAINNGGLVYRYDVNIDTIHNDLNHFLKTVTGTDVDPSFYPQH